MVPTFEVSPEHARNMARFNPTPTQARILHILSDGLRHSQQELMCALDDDLADTPALDMQLHRLRKKMEPEGETIVKETVSGPKVCYRHVRLLGNPYR